MGCSRPLKGFEAETGGGDGWVGGFGRNAGAFRYQSEISLVLVAERSRGIGSLAPCLGSETREGFVRFRSAHLLRIEGPTTAV